MWTLEKLIFSANEYYDALSQSMREAKESIALESYIFLPDEKGLGLLELMAKKAKEGVKVRLIIDGVGSRLWPREVLKYWRLQGIDIRIFHPIMWSFSPKMIYYLFSRINHRDHRKVCVVDGQCAFVSSFNVMKKSFDWQEMGVKIEGEEVDVLLKTFEVMWKKSYPRKNPLVRFRPIKGIDRLSTKWVQFNFTQALRKKLNKETYDRIAQAKSRVWIITPYFVPPLALIKSLKDAVANGADVRIILPTKSDVAFMPWIALYFTKILLAAGIGVYRYTPKMLHAKFLLIDDWLSIGSMNLNHRSFYLDVETNVVLKKESTIEEASKKFKALLAESQPITEGETNIRNPLLDLWVHFVLLLKGWL